MSSTAADTRGHVRQDSIAQKRSTPSKPRPGKPATAGPGGVGTIASRGSSSSPGSGDKVAFSMTPALAIKTTVVALVLFAILHFLPASSSSSSDSNSALGHEDRKALMDGSGEAWILPKRWREVGAGPGPVSLGGETLPECKRVMLFKFSDSHGFSSELLHYLRALVVGQKLGYTVLADDARWNYGALSEYFLPRLVYCRPPVDWYDDRQAVKLGSKRWQSKDRVWVSRDMEKEMDEWVREEMLDQSAVAELRDRKLGTILPEGETLPAALEEVYTDFSGVLKEVWRPNHQLAVLIRKQRMELGLGGGGLRHRKNSPNWGGRRRPSDRGSSVSAQDLAAEEEEFEQEYELHVAERSDRGPVIGVHLVGPKPPGVSLAAYGLSADARTGNVSATLEASADGVRRLSKSSIENPSYSRSRPTLFPATSTTTLVALTASDAAFDAFSTAATSGGAAATTANQLFHLVKTSAPPVDELTQRWGDVLGPDPRGRKGPSILEEWDQRQWNALPRALRIELTRYFVRDLTTLSRFADAFVVAGTSPTGVLSVLLAGEEGAIGPRDFEGGSFGGRVRSIDGFWVPTSSVKTLYG
ncbi:hypothetical protein JCM11491_000653 [Sporobolomyces phaffii]